MLAIIAAAEHSSCYSKVWPSKYTYVAMSAMIPDWLLQFAGDWQRARGRPAVRSL